MAAYLGLATDLTRAVEEACSEVGLTLTRFFAHPEPGHQKDSEVRVFVYNFEVKGNPVLTGGCRFDTLELLNRKNLKSLVMGRVAYTAKLIKAQENDRRTTIQN